MCFFKIKIDFSLSIIFIKENIKNIMIKNKLLIFLLIIAIGLMGGQQAYACHYSNAFASPPTAAFNCTTCEIDISFTTEVQGGLANTESLTLDFDAGAITNVVVTDVQSGTTGDANAGTTFNTCSGTGHDVGYAGDDATFSTNAPTLNDLCSGGGANGASVDLQLVISFDPSQPLPTTVTTIGLEGGGCDETAPFTLPDLSLDLQPDIALGGAGSTPAHCGNSDGSLQVTEASGNGCPPFMYSITAGPETRPDQTGTLFCDLASGDYTVQVVDNCGGMATTVLTILEDAAPTVTTVGVVACAGAAAEVTATCVPPATDNDAAPTSSTIYWYSDAAATTQIGTGSPFDATGFTTVYGVCEEIYNTGCSGADVICRSPAVETIINVYPNIAVELVPIKCDGDPDADNDPTNDADEYTYEVIVSLDGPLPVAGTIDLTGPITGSITTNTTDLVFTFDGPAPIPTTTAGTLTATITDANALGCSATYEVVDVGECSCIQYACADEVMYDAPDVTFGNAGNPDYTQTYVLVDAGNIVQVDANSTFDLSGQTVGTACAVAAVEYANDGVSDAFFTGATTLDELLNAADVDPCICLDVSFKCCYIYKEPDPVATPIDKILVCDGTDINQALTEVADALATPGAYSFDWSVDNTTIGDPALAASTDGDATNGGAVASGSTITFTGDGGTAGGTGNEATITVTPYYLADGPNTYDPPTIDWCDGAPITFMVCVASEITAAWAADCNLNDNEVAIDVFGGLPDLAGAGADAAAQYNFDFGGTVGVQTPTTATTDGGTFLFTGVPTGTYTVTVTDQDGAAAAFGCTQTVTVEVYDPLEIDFTETCTDGTIIVNNITGGQDPTGTWASNPAPFYDVTINGVTQQVTAGAAEFPLTFTVPGEGNYDVGVADANGCVITFEAEAYDLITFTDNNTCNTADNSLDVTIDGGQPDHPGTADIGNSTNGDPAGTTTYDFSSYTVTTNLPAAGTPIPGNPDATSGQFTATGLPAGCHTLTFTHDLLEFDSENLDGNVVGTDTGTDCSETIDIEVYDPFNIDFTYTCDANQIIVNNITGGQDPAIAWCGTTAASYTVTINGATQTVTSPADFPLTFTGLAEGTYDVVVADANGCGYTWQAEAYEPIVITDSGQRCDLNNQISLVVVGGQPDHPGTTDIITETNGTGSGVNTGDNYGLGNYTVTLDGPLGTGTLIGTSTNPADGSLITNVDALGNLLPCGSHDIHFTYTLFDDDGTDTGITCELIERVDIYDLLDADLSTPACGSIDIDNITGGYDINCPNGYDTPSPGYTITIEGPLAGTGIPGVPSQLYTFSGSPTALTSVSFTPGDASGVPVNGLPGGEYEIVIIDGLNDGNCPFVETIEIVGCCPASTDANTDYQLCGLNDPTAQPGPTSMLNPTPTPIFGDLPSLTVNNTATNLNIDPDTDLTLNTDDGGSGQDAGGDGVDWFLGPDPLSAQPYSDNAMVSASVCAPGIYTLYAFLRCDGNHDGNFTPSQTGTNPGSEVGFDPTGTDSYIPAGTVTVTVWPEIAIPDVSYPNDPVECQVNLENPCPDVYVLEVTDDDGNNYITDNSGGLFLGPGNIYTYDGLATPLPGTIGDLTLTITNPAAQAAFDAANPGGDDSYSDGDNVTCREFTFERDYVCCLAEAGGLDASFECPPTELADGTIDGAGDPTTITIDDYMGDNGTLQLPNYQTYVIIADAAGNIYGVVLAAETDGTGTLSSNLPVNIPYGDYAGYNGYGVDYYYYSYNVFLSNPPVAACLPVGITVPSPPAVSTVVGAATTIAQVTTCTSPFEGCFDLSSPDVVYIPEPLSLVCDQDVSQGGFGGIGPVYYNIHEICIAGGTPPYDYHWDTEGYVRHSIIKNPPVGEGDEKIRIIYSDRAVWRVTVYDANGCTHDPTWYFTNDMSAPGALLDIAQAVVTPGNTNGSQFNICTTGGIDICVEGGTPPYTYDWYGPNTWTGGPMLGMSATGAGTCSSGSEAYSLTGLPLGWYQVTITDSAPAPDTQITYDWYWVYCVTPGRGKVNSFTDNHLTAMPNPVNSTTTIEYSSTEAGKTVVSLYDINGKQVLDLFRGEVEANTTYSLPFTPGRLASGIYVLRMTTASGMVKNHKLMITK